MNRLASYFRDAPEEEPEWGDHYVVSGPFGYAFVSYETAAEIERALDRRWPPRWITFRDLSGSRVRVKTEVIKLLSESSAEQRAADRRFERARRREEDADRSTWEDDQ